MGVTFNIVSISDDGSESISTSLPTISPRTIARSTRAKKYATALPNDVAIWLPLGSEGPTIKSKSLIKSASDYTQWDAVKSCTLLYVSASNLPEFPASSYWWVDLLDLNREAGWVNHWILDITLERAWRKANGDKR